LAPTQTFKPSQKGSCDEEALARVKELQENQKDKRKRKNQKNNSLWKKSLSEKN